MNVGLVIVSYRTAVDVFVEDLFAFIFQFVSSEKAFPAVCYRKPYAQSDAGYSTEPKWGVVEDSCARATSCAPVVLYS